MRYLIIGNGVAGATAAMALRKRDEQAAITMISGESDYFFSRTALMYAYMDRLSRRDLEPFERSVWKKQNIRRLRAWVKDLDAGRGEVTLETGESIGYDRLLLATGSRPNRPAWEGLDQARDGFVHFVSMQDLDRCERLTAPGGKAIVVGGGLIGVELVECLAHHGMDVTFLILEPWYWPVAMAAGEGEMISEHLRRHGVRVIHNEEMERVETDSAGRVKGILTRSGKAMQCGVLGVCIGVHPAVEWLAEVTTPPRIGRGIQVAPDFSTSLPNVWAAGDCAEILLPGARPLVEQIWYSAKRQGELAARAMAGDRIAYDPPIFYNSSRFFEIEFTTVGTVNNAPEGARHFYCRLPGKDVSVRIVEWRSAVAGFNMLGSRWNHTFFERWISERRGLDYVMARLPEAQFDVEFGRQDLSHVLSAYASWRKSEPAAVGGKA
ncbi:MAG TPA: NAD(P)/FAD-dependent oxidoreductase [Bryobacteraceae bacterium]|nr:NAD(P)/FAD-dependent oxidoreductase [Bryobacteraceae bacterium]